MAPDTRALPAATGIAWRNAPVDLDAEPTPWEAGGYGKNTFVNSPIADGAGYVETWEIP